jgi:hypothetical protein
MRSATRSPLKIERTGSVTITFTAGQVRDVENVTSAILIRHPQSCTGSPKPFAVARLPSTTKERADSSWFTPVRFVGTMLRKPGQNSGHSVHIGCRRSSIL